MTSQQATTRQRGKEAPRPLARYATPAPSDLGKFNRLKTRGVEFEAPPSVITRSRYWERLKSDGAAAARFIFSEWKFQCPT